MSDVPQLLVLGSPDSVLPGILQGLDSRCEVIVAKDLEEGLVRLQSLSPQGICVCDGDLISPGALLEFGGFLNQLPDGLLVLDESSRILWSNSRVSELLEISEPINGMLLFEAFSDPEIIGPDFCPLNTALGTGEQTRTTLRTGEKSYFELGVSPIVEPGQSLPRLLLITVRDTSSETLQRQKLNAIYQAGLDLGDLQPEEVLELSVEDRIELLKSKLLHYTQDLMEFETVEIRIVEKETQRLRPLLALGMVPDAEGRELMVSAEGNGVTGFVAATGRSYLCEDTTKDPLYLVGAEGARSSLTVPLVLHEEVFGTFNVESPRPGAFNETDLQFLELFCREVAVALNTLDLLVAEKATTVAESTKRLLCDVADPVDEILNDAAWILEKHVGEDPSVVERLRKILAHTQAVREQIRTVGDSFSIDGARGLSQSPMHPELRAKRILVVDADKDIRRASHEILGRLGCIVETAHDGEEALLMARTFDYDVVLSDIRLPDINGAEVYRRMQELHADLPVILMTSFGYDAEHCIVKARQMGLKAVLYKPFRLDQLLRTVAEAVHPQPSSDASGHSL